MKNVEINLPSFDLKDRYHTAKVIAVRIAWLRQVCPQLKIDTKRAIIAEILSNIIGDDESSFGRSYNPNQISTMQRLLQIRMDTEIDTPETPENIRQQLVNVRTRLFASNWSSKTDYIQARETWTSGVRNYVQAQIDSHREYRDMIADSLVDALTFTPHWQKFLYGKIIARPLKAS